MKDGLYQLTAIKSGGWTLTPVETNPMVECKRCFRDRKPEEMGKESNFCKDCGAASYRLRSKLLKTNLISKDEYRKVNLWMLKQLRHEQSRTAEGAIKILVAYREIEDDPLVS